LSKPVGYDGAIHNDGYLKNSSYCKWGKYVCIRQNH
jgi:hypothetical protein